MPKGCEYLWLQSTQSECGESEEVVGEMWEKYLVLQHNQLLQRTIEESGRDTHVKKDLKPLAIRID